jgi:ABC-type branched-subunit amino acid transport system permease subunit/ABC-type branched-subunit amino acid transport system ATPase component
MGLNAYYIHIAALVLIYSSLALGLNVVVGLAGLLDLGYIGFYAVGAYTYALLTTQMDASRFAAVAAAGLSALAIGVLLGWPTIRTHGDYLALVTLGFGEMIRLLARNWTNLTNGPRGIMDIPPPGIGKLQCDTPAEYYYIALLLASFALAVFLRIRNSSVGLQLAAIRDDEQSAAAIGVDVVRWKLYAFGVGALVAGLAGAFFASFQRFVSPESFSLNESLLVLSIVVLGGAGRALPVVCSAFFLVIMPEILRGFERYRPLVLGLVLVAVVVFQERLAARRRLLQENTDEQNDVDGCHLPGCSNAILPPPSDPLLTVRNLSKAFGAVQALAGVNFDVYAGEIVGVVGMNGAGKTTLLSCIAGSTLADHGEVELFANGSWETLGNSVPAFRRAQRGVVRTFQQPRLFGSLTASENVEVGARCHSTPRFWEPLFRTSISRKFEEGSSKAPWSAFNVLASAKLTAEMTFIDQKSTELARALATNPLLLLVDEPASGNSPAGRRRLARILDGARAMGVSMIVVEHDLEFLRSICNRLLVMREGAILAAGDLNSPQIWETIREVYGVQQVSRPA